MVGTNFTNYNLFQFINLNHLCCRKRLTIVHNFLPSREQMLPREVNNMKLVETYGIDRDDALDFDEVEVGDIFRIKGDNRITYMKIDTVEGHNAINVENSDFYHFWGSEICILPLSMEMNVAW